MLIHQIQLHFHLNIEALLFSKTLLKCPEDLSEKVRSIPSYQPSKALKRTEKSSSSEREGFISDTHISTIFNFCL